MFSSPTCYNRTTLKQLTLLVGLVCFCAPILSGQLAWYVDENGRKVYVNAPPKPDTVTDATKQKPSKRYSVLVKNGKTIPAPAADPAPITPQAAPVPIDSLIKQTADRHAVDPDLVRAMVQVESNFNPHAVSNKGARGLMQLIPSTAKELGVGNSFNPQENLDGGVRYLKQMMGIFGGDLNRSLAAYNAGAGAVTRHGGVPPYRETQNYVKKISDLYGPLAKGTLGNRLGIVKYVDENGRMHFTNVP